MPSRPLPALVAALRQKRHWPDAAGCINVDILRADAIDKNNALRDIASRRLCSRPNFIAERISCWRTSEKVRRKPRDPTGSLREPVDALKDLHRRWLFASASIGTR